MGLCLDANNGELLSRLQVFAVQYPLACHSCLLDYHLRYIIGRCAVVDKKRQVDLPRSATSISTNQPEVSAPAIRVRQYECSHCANFNRPRQYSRKLQQADSRESRTRPAHSRVARIVHTVVAIGGFANSPIAVLNNECCVSVGIEVLATARDNRLH